MPGHVSATLTFVFLVAIAFATNRAEESTGASLRDPASVSRKEAVFNGSLRTAPTLLHTEKIHGPLFVSLEVDGSAPAHIGDVFTLRGSLVSHKPIQTVNFQWTLPAGIELVSGSLSGQLDYIGPDAAGDVRLTLKKVSDGNAQIHFLASANRGAGHFADSAQYNTQDQEQLSAQKEQMKENTAKAVARLKVIH